MRVFRTAGLSLACLASFLVTSGFPASTEAAPDAKAAASPVKPTSATSSNPFATLAPAVPAALLSALLSSLCCALTPKVPTRLVSIAWLRVMKDALVHRLL